MLGSMQDAEDLVQETYLRAWRGYGGVAGRSSVRAWLYPNAPHQGPTQLGPRPRPVLPSGLGAPEPDPHAHPADAGPQVSWLQPVPDALVTPESADPGAIVAAREGLRLALIASLQYLPPRQRAVLVLRDVLAFPAAEIAVMLGTTTVSVKSALQRARGPAGGTAPARRSDHRAGRAAGPRPPRPVHRGVRAGRRGRVGAAADRGRHPGSDAAADLVRRPEDLHPVPARSPAGVTGRLAHAAFPRQR